MSEMNFSLNLDHTSTTELGMFGISATRAAEFSEVLTERLSEAMGNPTELNRKIFLELLAILSKECKTLEEFAYLCISCQGAYDTVKGVGNKKSLSNMLEILGIE